MWPVARLHPQIKGVAGGQTSGANIVSFNQSRLRGYGQEQGANAPVGTYAAFAYTTAANALLARDFGHRAQAGSVTVLFWAGRQAPNEAVICPFLVAMAYDDPARGSLTCRHSTSRRLSGARPALMMTPRS